MVQFARDEYVAPVRRGKGDRLPKSTHIAPGQEHNRCLNPFRVACFTDDAGDLIGTAWCAEVEAYPPTDAVTH